MDGPRIERRQSDCLSFAELSCLAQDPQAGGRAHAHLARCPRCRTLLEKLAGLPELTPEALAELDRADAGECP